MLDSSRVAGSWPPYRTLDAWRGAAALWVVFFHADAALVTLHPAAAHNPISYIFSRFGHLGVQMFFVISGYCIANAAQVTVVRRSPPHQYLWARVRRIFPTYWAAMLLFVLASIFSSWLVERHVIPSSTLAGANPLKQGWRSVVTNLTLTNVAVGQVPVLYQAWTLCYELAFYLIIGAGLWVSLRRQSRLLMLGAAHVLTVVCCALLMALPRILPGQDLRYPLDLWPQFGLGVLLFDLLNERRRAFSVVAALLALGFTLTYIACYDRPVGCTHASSRLTFSFVVAFAVLLFLLKAYDLEVSSAWPVRVLARVGAFSYSLYLIHFLFVGFVRQTLHGGHLAEIGYPAQLALILAGSLFVGWALFQLAEKPLLSKGRTVVVPRKQAQELRPDPVVAATSSSFQVEST